MTSTLLLYRPPFPEPDQHANLIGLGIGLCYAICAVYWPVAVVVLIAGLCFIGYRLGVYQRRRRREICDRCALQDQLWLRGDERGLYGEFPPAVSARAIMSSGPSTTRCSRYSPMSATEVSSNKVQ